jgi:uncharacterized membrane protein
MVMANNSPMQSIQPDSVGGKAMTKTLSFAAVHFSVAFTVGYLMSGSVLVGGAIALVEPAINTVAYHFHEKLWCRLAEARPQAADGFARQM